MTWFLARTKYGNEQTASDNLESQGYGSYYPVIDIEKLVDGKRKTVTEPAFRGYVFVNFDPDTQSAFRVNNTKGVYQLVVFGGEITPIHDSIISAIRAAFEAKAISRLPQKGEAVTIKSGPFKGLDAIFQEPDGEARSLILINLLNQQKTIIIDNKSIARH
jgi:transcriptional antiterminator RfaH